MERSLSRPHVSDDNPFSEAQFKTMKYAPGYPPGDRLHASNPGRDPCSARSPRWGGQAVQARCVACKDLALFRMEIEKDAELSGIENQIARRLLELGANRVARDLLLRDRFAPGMPIVGAHRGAMGLDGRITRYSGIYRDIPGYSGMGWKNNGISRDLMTPRRWLAWRWKPRLTSSNTPW